MRKAIEFMKEEVKKPIVVLKKTAILCLKFAALSLLRLVIWAFFFLLPIIVLFFFALHWVTDKARSNLGTASPVHTVDEPASASTDLRSIPFGLRTLTRDIKFWVSELERFKR